MALLRTETAPQEQRSQNWVKVQAAFFQGLEAHFKDFSNPYETSVSQETLSRSLTAYYLLGSGMMTAGLTAKIVISSSYINQINESLLPQNGRRTSVSRLIEAQDTAIGDYHYAKH